MLSIIVPTLNEQQTIETSLSALQPLRRRGVEVIVVDGGSEDNSIRLACPLCDNAIVAKRGRASQMNAGARQSTGDILLFLHSDTVLPEGALEAIDQAFMAPRLRLGAVRCEDRLSVAPPEWRRIHDEPAIPMDGNRDRRPGHLRHTRRI